MAVVNEPLARKLTYAVIHSVMFTEDYYHLPESQKGKALKKALDSYVNDIIERTFMPEYKIRQLAVKLVQMTMEDEDYKEFCNEIKQRDFDADFEALKDLLSAKAVEDIEKSRAKMPKHGSEMKAFMDAEDQMTTLYDPNEPVDISERFNNEGIL